MLNMSQTIISDLNDDVLLEIFSYLHGKDLKKSAQVCKRWNEVISTNGSTMSKLPLMLNEDWQQLNKSFDLMKLSRSFHTITMMSPKTNIKLVKAIQKYSEHLHHVEIIETGLPKKFFVQILKTLKACTKLTLRDVYTTGSYKVPKGLNLENLKTLTLKSKEKYSSMSSLIDNMQNLMEILGKAKTNLRTLKIRMAEIGFAMDDSEKDTFVEFLSKHVDLEVLAVHCTYTDFFKSFSLVNLDKFKFKLKKLAINIPKVSETTTENENETFFMGFLDRQKETLKEIEIKRFASAEILQFVVKNMLINKLTTDVTDFPTSSSFYNSLRPNRHLTSLSIKDELSNEDVAQGIFHVFPALQRFVIDDWKNDIADEILLSIANNLQHLSYLSIPNLPTNLPEIPIQNLKTIYLDLVDDVNTWKDFLMNNPTIEVIFVKWLTDSESLNHEMLNEITMRLQQLKEMNVGARFQPSINDLGMMSRNCPNFKKLEIFDPANADRDNATYGQLNVFYSTTQAAGEMFDNMPSMWLPEIDAWDSDYEDDDSRSIDESLSFDDIFDSDSDSDRMWHIYGGGLGHFDEW